MKFKKTLLLATLICIASYISFFGREEEKGLNNSDDRPNIIVVMADDMGFSDLGSYGGEIKTPVIDRLASEGVRFSQFYNCGICGPSRASLMTGCYPWDVGVTTWDGMLNDRGATILQLLKINGYRTCVVGRLDNIITDNWYEPAQIAQYCDRFLGTPTGGPGNYFREADRTPWFKDGKRWERPVGVYSTDLISDFVVDFIEGSAGSEKPFFIYVSHYAPHWPLQAKKKDIAPYLEIYKKQERKKLMQTRLQRQINMGLIPDGTMLIDSIINAKPIAEGYLSVERMAINAAMVESIDQSLANTMDALKKAGKLDNTLILVLSDNGASSQGAYEDKVRKGVRPGSMNTFLYHGPALAAMNNTPFKGYKLSNYEGGIVSPLIAWWPRGLKGKGRISNRLSHISDIMPTCLELAGVSYPSQFQGRKIIPMKGKSFVSVIEDTEGDQNDHEVLVFSRAVREKDWKLVMEDHDGLELYHISTDRNERENLAAQFPDRVQQLKKMHSKIYSQ
jgi:arylsulfatase